MTRFRELDGLRGVAALQVALAHAVGIVDWVGTGPGWAKLPIRLLMIAHPSVVLFFVLSGFVLTRSLLTGPKTSYWVFVIRRLCRIYIPFFFALSTVVLLCVILKPAPLPGLSVSFADHWSDYSVESVARHALMTGLPKDMQLLPVMWSLVYELRISILLPFLVALLAWRTRSVVISSVVCAISAWAYLNAVGEANFWSLSTIPNTFALTVFYVFPFAVGATLVIRWEEISAWSRTMAAKLTTLAFFAFSGALIAIISLSSLLADVVLAVFAGGVIWAAISWSWLRTILTTGPVQFAGKISYSLYLIHLPVYFAIAHAFDGVLPLSSVGAIAFPVAMVSAYLMNRFVELPAARLGAQIGKTRVAYDATRAGEQTLS